MKRGRAALCCTMLGLSTALLSGCWDREYLKDLNLAYSVGFDLIKDHKIKETVELIIPPKTEQSATTNEIHSAVGLSTRGASNILRARVRGNMRVIKNSVQLIGRSLAEEGLKAPMDVNFRDPQNPSSDVRLVVTENDASEIIGMKKIGELQIGEFLTQKISSLERMSLFYPPETVNTVFRSLTDPGQDFALPYIGVQGSEIVAKGVALFHDQSLSGSLGKDQSIMLVLMKGKSGGNARFTKTVNLDTTKPIRGSISYNVGNKKRKRVFHVSVARNGDVHVTLRLKLQAVIEEFTGPQLLDDKAVTRVNRELSSIMTEEAREVVRELQQANCDIFGVGRQLMAYHPKLWKRIDWNKEYRNVQFHTQVQVSIIDTGVIQ